MTKAKERMRDAFYMNMYEKFKIDEQEVKRILQDAEIDLKTFQVSKLKLYEETVEKAMKKVRIRKMMQPFKRIACPYPECEGDKITYTRSGKALWFCSEGGDSHRVVWRTARLKVLMDLKAGLIKEDETGDKIVEFIKEYERYVEGKTTQES